MKTLVVDFIDPTDGDLIIIEYASPRGGVTSVKHTVVGAHQKAKADADGVVQEITTFPAETPHDIARDLAFLINKDWMHEAFEAKVGGTNKSSLVIGCTGLVNDVTFKGFVEGSGATKVSITEF
jgi:hypothetical protein